MVGLARAAHQGQGHQIGGPGAINHILLPQGRALVLCLQLETLSKAVILMENYVATESPVCPYSESPTHRLCSQKRNNPQIKEPPKLLAKIE